jgi:hypothetical protein
VRLGVRLYFCVALLVAATTVASAAGAVTARLEVDRFARADLAGAQAARADFLARHTVGNLRAEGFEGYRPWGAGGGTQDPGATRVGSFAALGHAGSGRSVVGDGRRLQVRSDNTMRWGRYDADAAPSGLAGNWLDSNDNTGMEWRLSGLGKLNVLAFFVIDAADVGGRFSIRVGDTLFSDLAGGRRLANGNIHFVRIFLDHAVDDLTVRLMHDRTNDGFGIDGVLAGRIAPVPLPPAAALMLPALALLAGARRRGRRA